MIKTVIRRFLPVYVLLACIFISGCEDKDFYDPTKDPNYVSETPSTLDFSTSQTIKLQLNYNIAKGFVSTFDLYTEYPLAKNGSLREDLKPIAGGIDVAGYSQLKRVIPSYVTDLYLYSGSLFVPLLSYAKIENGTASFSMCNVEIEETVEGRAGNAGILWKMPLAGYLKTEADFYDETANGNYLYDLIKPDTVKTVAPEVLTAIAKTFRESKIVDEKYYKDATIRVKKGKDSETGAEVFVSVLHSGATFSNSLSYFVYTGTKELTELPQAEVEALEIINIFQYADVHTNSTLTSKKGVKGLTPGKYVQLLYKNASGKLVKEFPIGAQIGWVLHPNSFKAADFSVTEPNYVVRLFSVSYWNDANNLTNVPNVRTNNYNIFFSATDNEGYTYNCFGFEDQPKFASDGDCNDVIFHVLTNPVDAITAPPSITEEDIEKTEEKNGILAFEDNWPKQGDYDLNDVVVKYSSTITYVQTVKIVNGTVIENTDINVKKVEDRFSFIHTGAAFKNAFSYKVDLLPGVIKSITITNERTGAVVDYTSKITADHNGFIIDLCPNVKDVIPNMVPVTDPQNYTVVMEFNEGMVSQDEFVGLTAPYNPFITPSGYYPGAEVHLPMYLPTSRIDMDLFNTEDDRSDKMNLWFVSGENNKFPFAIHLNGAGDDFEIPTERQKIYVTYPRYTNWVNSNMTSDKDWYINR